LKNDYSLKKLLTALETSQQSSHLLPRTYHAGWFCDDFKEFDYVFLFHSTHPILMIRKEK